MMKRILCMLALAASSAWARVDAFLPTSALKAGSVCTASSPSCNPSLATKHHAGYPVLTHRQTSATTALALATAAGGARASDPSNNRLMETLQTGSYFGLWYLFNIAYNIYNKQALNILDFPWTIATIQMAAGLLYFVPLWMTGVRKAPKLSRKDLQKLFPIALCHTGVHVGAVVALGAGAVSFAHIVKASEPVVTCALNGVFLNQVLPLNVYLTLIPIISGVAIASAKELSFTWLALGAAMLSNLSSSARGVLSKKTMSGVKIGENLDAQNLYAVLTAMSTVVLIPAMLAMEGTTFFSAFNRLTKLPQHTTKSLSLLLFLSGASYYAYNEVAFLALGKVNAVTHAVGNTIKRVVIIVASVIAFNTRMSRGSIIGSTIAILGTLLYSLAMNTSKAKAAK